MADEIGLVTEAVSLVLSCVVELSTRPGSQSRDQVIDATSSRSSLDVAERRSPSVADLGVRVIRFDDAPPCTAVTTDDRAVVETSASGSTVVMWRDRCVAAVEVAWPKPQPATLTWSVASAAAPAMVHLLCATTVAATSPSTTVAGPNAAQATVDARRRVDAWLRSEDLLDTLTDREREVVAMLLQGHRTSTIATALFLSRHTVRNHLKRIFRKVGVHSQVDLVSRIHAHHTRTG